MAGTRRTLAIAIAIVFTVIGPILSVLVSGRLAVYLGWRSYPIYVGCQVLSSFLILWLYNPAKRGFFQRMMERLTKFDFERSAVKKLIGVCGIALAIGAVNFAVGPFVGAMFIKQLGYRGAKAYAYAALADVVCVIIGNTIYLFLLDTLLKKLF